MIFHTYINYNNNYDNNYNCYTINDMNNDNTNYNNK